jgi:hypothetical protein
LALSNHLADGGLAVVQLQRQELVNLFAMPTYCYTSHELNYFYLRFNEKTTPSIVISTLIRLGRCVERALIAPAFPTVHRSICHWSSFRKAR